ncbi:kinase-like domain-containing protein [Mycena floridula]|nr:kinase-like domain-containing protein [Mycena floridula]
MATLDPISRLVDSRQLRLKLLEVSAEVAVSDDRRLREALEQDDMMLAKLLCLVVNSDADKKTVLALQGADAQHLIDLIQEVLDKGTLRNLTDDGITMKARRLLVKLSQSRDILPSCLFIKGVKRLDKDATYGGTFGDIFRASYQGTEVALKRVRVFQRDSAAHKIRQVFIGFQMTDTCLTFYQRLCREALLWQRLQHPYVLPFSGIDSETFPSFLCMVSPWMKNGTILNYLSANGHANIERRILEIAQGLQYLHSQGIVHGDLRGSNILVNEEWHSCIADFGLAVFAEATFATTHQAGSIRWMAPELHDPHSFGLKTWQRSLSSDVFSFACVCIEVRKFSSGSMSQPELIYTALHRGTSFCPLATRSSRHATHLGGRKTSSSFGRTSWPTDTYFPMEYH